MPKVATGFVANILCSETFVSGQTAGADILRNHRRDARRQPDHLGASTIRVDRARKDVTVTLFGFGRSHAVYRGRPWLLSRSRRRGRRHLGAGRTMQSRSRRCCRRSPGLAWSRRRTPQLAAALDRAFAEPEQPPLRRTRAIVVVKDGRVVAERYAEGYGIDTPILGFSATKSVISALTGILVRKGKLDARSARADRGVAGRRTIRGMRSPSISCCVTPQASRSAARLQASLGAAFEPVNRMKFMESDMAAYAESIELATPPGSAWNYNDGNTIILSHLIRNAAGGSASDVLRFARQELFAPLGMRNVTLEFDASAMPEGSSQMLASRARLGALRHALSQ